MQSEIMPKSFWQKLIIFWHTREFGKRIETLAKALSVGIYLDREFTDSERKIVHEILTRYLVNEKDISYVLEYIEMKLGDYKKDYENFKQDKAEIIKMIRNDIELLNFIEDIIDADEVVSENEKKFLDEIKGKL